MTLKSDPSFPLHIMLIAGEPSGDALGSQLLKALKNTGGSFRFTGVGGPLMAAEGFNALYPMDEIAVMGLAQVAPRLRLLRRRVEQAVNHARTTMPDAVVLIDSPGFNHPVARRLKKRGFTKPIIKYVAPQVWASRPERAQKIARFIDHLLVLFPFEPAYFEAVSLPTTFVGHPLTERVVPPGVGATFRIRHGIEPGAPVLCLLPGSRVNEIRFLLPLFRRTVRKLRQRIPDLELIVPVLPHVSRRVRDELAGWGIGITFVDSQQESEKFSAFAASNVALAASGTVSLELAQARVPHVIGYKLGWLTAELARPFITVSFATLINIKGGGEIVPEFIQERCQPWAMAEAVERFMLDEEVCAAHLTQVASVMETLHVKGTPPSERAAQTVLDVIHRWENGT